MNSTNMLIAATMGIAVSMVGLTVAATPAAAHPCIGNTGGTFTCLEPDGEEGTFVCVGTYDDDNNNGKFDHNEEDTFLCTNGQT